MEEYKIVKLVKLILFFVLLPLFLNYEISSAQEASSAVLNQINIDKIRAASGIDYILLPNGEKVYADNTTYTVYTNGTYTFTVYDKAGNRESVTVEINNIDTTLPSLKLTQTEEDEYIYVDIYATDNESGFSHIVLPSGEQIDENTTRIKISKAGQYTFQAYDVAGNITEETLNISDIEIAELLVSKAEKSRLSNDISIARDAVNLLPEVPEKELLQERLNNITNIIDIEPVERLDVTSNLDIYIKYENALSLTLNTNFVQFEGFSGVEDMRLDNAINLTVNSSLPYNLSAYLVSEIQNADKTKTIEKGVLNIKESSETNYQTFKNLNEKVVLKGNNLAGNNIVHGIDFLLKGSISHDADVYKTTVKFEVEQK